jgi:hypothetical protein
MDPFNNEVYPGYEEEILYMFWGRLNNPHREGITDRDVTVVVRV